MGDSTNIQVGTASWSDIEFIKAGWYPDGLPASERLAYYASQFDMVELNSSFYAVPTQVQFAKWAQQTPPQFVFNIKIHRFLSRHQTPLKALPMPVRQLVKAPSIFGENVILNPDLEEQFTHFFLQQIAPLEKSNKLGALLLQLSPHFSPYRHQFDEIDCLIHNLQFGNKEDAPTIPRNIVIELRHREWLSNPKQLQYTQDFFSERGVSLVSIDGPKVNDPKHSNILPEIDLVTQPKVGYLRLHGRNTQAYLTGKTVAERFCYRYSLEELGSLVTRVKEIAKQVKFMFVIFNNNSADFAPRMLRDLESF